MDRNPRKGLPESTIPPQLVQENDNFRSPLSPTSDQLQHIATILDQHRQTVEIDDGTDKNIENNRTEQIVSNTRTVYCVMMPRESKKSLPSFNIHSGIATPIHNCRKLRRLQHSDFVTPSIHKIDLDQARDSDKKVVSIVLSNKSHEEREEKKCSNLSRPPYHRTKNYKRINHPDSVQSKLYSSSGYIY